ncbi:MAG: hypothetical protein PVG08_14505, partial [Desulfobacterales bacterium]
SLLIVFPTRNVEPRTAQHRFNIYAACMRLFLPSAIYGIGCIPFNFRAGASLILCVNLNSSARFDDRD